MIEEIFNNDKLAEAKKLIEDFKKHHDELIGTKAEPYHGLTYTKIADLLSAQGFISRDEQRREQEYRNKHEIPSMILREILSDNLQYDLVKGRAGDFLAYYESYKRAIKRAYEYRKEGKIKGKGIDNAQYWEDTADSDRAHLHTILSETINTQQILKSFTPPPMQNNEEQTITFYPDAACSSCGICGIMAFAHLHRPGTKPKDFEIIPEKDQSQKSEQEKKQKMLDKIMEQAHLATKYTILAMLTKNDKEQNEFIEKIMKFNEQIEEQYSSNWH